MNQQTTPFRKKYFRFCQEHSLFLKIHGSDKLCYIFSKHTQAMHNILLVDSQVVIQGHTDQDCSVQIDVQTFRRTQSVLLLLSRECAYTSTSYSFPCSIISCAYLLSQSSDIHTRSCSCPEDLMTHWVIVLSQQDLTTRTQEDFVLTHSVKLAHLCVSKL